MARREGQGRPLRAERSLWLIANKNTKAPRTLAANINEYKYSVNNLRELREDSSPFQPPEENATRPTL